MNFMSLLSQLCMSQWKKLASLQTRRPRCSQHFKHGASAPNTEQNNLSVPSASKKNPLLLFFQVFYFPLSSYQVFFFFSNFLSTKQANTAQRHHSAADLLPDSLQRKKGQKLALIWFIYYDSKCESNCFHAKLSALCFAVDAMQQNNAEKLFPKIRSIYVPNSVTHAVSDFWDEFNSIHLIRLNWRAKTKCLFKSYNNDKDFI